MRRKIWMARIKTTLPQREIETIRNHLETTAWSLVMCYTQAQLAALDWVSTSVIRHSGKYMPVRFDNRMARRDFHHRNDWRRKPYTIKRIRVDEIKFVYNRRNKRHKLVEEPI